MRYLPIEHYKRVQKKYKNHKLKQVEFIRDQIKIYEEDGTVNGYSLFSLYSFDGLNVYNIFNSSIVVNTILINK